MLQFHLGEASGSKLGSHNGSTNRPIKDISPNRTSQAPCSRRRTDEPPTQLRIYSQDTVLLESTKNPKLQHCLICLESTDSSLWTRPSVLCAHEPKACGPCFRQYVTHAIKEGLTEISCPDVECRKEMEYKDVVACVWRDVECLRRYNALLVQREMERHPDFVWCTNPQCGRGQIHIGGATSPLVICYHCYAHTCFVHRIPWHDNLTCKQYTKQEETNASERYIVTHTKRCPNTGCGRPIEKISGCDHMICRRPGGCGHEFCWICLADYALIHTEGNHKHNPGCRHYVGLANRAHFMLGAQIDEEILPRTLQLLRPIRCFRPGRIILVPPPPPAEAEEPVYLDVEPPRRRPSRAIERLVVAMPETDSETDTLRLPDLRSLRRPPFHYHDRETPSAPTPSSSLGTEVAYPPGTEASSSRFTAEALSLPPRTTTGRSSPEPTEVSRAIRRITATRLRLGEQIQPPGSELYQSPLHSQPVQPEVPESPHRHCGAQRRRVTFQEPTVIQDRETGESPMQARVTRGELVPEREREERQLSSIPDFESEILLDFVGGHYSNGGM